MLIPTKLRTIVAKTLSHSIRLDIAEEIYWKVTNLIAKKFLSIDGIENVLLRGGMLTKITPGFSDVDITLISSNSLSLDKEICLWEKVKKTFNILKMVFPIIGEIQLFREDEWNFYKRISSEDMFIFDSQLEYYDKKWIKNPLYEKIWNPSTSVRFLKAFSYYRDAMNLCNSSSYYNNYLFKKSLYKSKKCLEESSINEESLVDAFIDLDKLANKALHEKINKAVPNKSISSIQDEKYILSIMMSDAILKKLNLILTYNLYLTKIPFCYVLEASSKEDIANFFVEYEKKVRKKINPKPVFISKNMYQMLLRSWSRWWPNSDIDFPFFPISMSENNSKWLYISLLNRITNNMIGIFYTYLIKKEAEILNGLNYLSVEIMNLISSKFSRNKTELLNECKKVNTGFSKTLISLLNNSTISLLYKILTLRKLINEIINLNRCC